MSKVPCSVGILTFNSGSTLRRALESVKDFSDIMVCDGGSSDETLTIAREFGARTLQQDAQFLHTDGRIADYSGVRNRMLESAKEAWFLYIDSDEYLSEKSQEEIAKIVASAPAADTPAAYWLPRKTVVGGEIVECASVYPNYQLRLFYRPSTSGFIKKVHERVALKPGTVVGKLHYPEYVPLDMSSKEYRAKQLRYLHIEKERHISDSFGAWLKGPVWGATRSSVSFALRHFFSLLFCRGTKMPQWVEWSHYWYNWKLITMTGAKFFRRR